MLKHGIFEEGEGCGHYFLFLEDEFWSDLRSNNDGRAQLNTVLEVS